MIELKFDFKRFGCNEKAVEDLVKEIVRCVNNVWHDETYTTTWCGAPVQKIAVSRPEPPKPKGVYVKPGMRVFYTCTAKEVTVAPRNLYMAKFGNDDRIGFWDDAGYLNGHYAHYFTHNGLPVIGYEEDEKP